MIIKWNMKMEAETWGGMKNREYERYLKCCILGSWLVI